MALLKTIEGPLGVPLEYHRIVLINVLTNVENTIHVNSYLNKIEREREASFVNGEVTDIENQRSVYSEGAVYSLPYDQFMTIDSAYEYLKTLDEFKDAIDC